MTQLVWVFIPSSKFVQNFTEVGYLALGLSGIGRAGFPKTRWPPLFPLLCTLSAHSQNFKHINDCLSVCFLKYPFKIFWLPSPEGARNISPGRDFRESRARRNRPNRTGLDYVYVFMDVRTTKTAQDVHLHNTNMTVPMIAKYLLLILSVCVNSITISVNYIRCKPHCKFSRNSQHRIIHLKLILSL